MKVKIYLFSLVLVAVCLFSGCGWFDQIASGVSTVVGKDETATVIAKSGQVRTSYAVVAADLLEVKRGDRLDVLDEIEFEKVLWYRVRVLTTKCGPKAGSKPKT